MTEITFEDILTHYYLKLKQTLDETESIRLYAKNTAEIADPVWKGNAANAFQEKMRLLDKEIDNSGSEISEAMKAIAAIADKIQ